MVSSRMKSADERKSCARQQFRVSRKVVLSAWVFVAAASVFAANPLDTWHARTCPLPSANLAAISYGNGRFVAYADSLNRILTSTNGSDWEVHPAPYPNFRTLSFGNGAFMAGFDFVSGQPQRIYSSADGVAWTLRLVAPADDVTYINALEFGNGKYVAVGSAIWVSPDLTNWTATAYGTVSFSDVAFGNGVFAAVDGSAIWTSPDGASWTYRGSSFGASRVAFGNGRFVSVGYPSGRSVVSVDGATWTLSGTTNVPAPFMTGPLTFGGGYFVSLGATAGSSFLASTNGMDWELHDFGTNWAPSAVAFGNNTFVAAGGPGHIFQTGPVTNSLVSNPPSLGISRVPSLSLSGEVGRDYRIEYTESLSGTSGFQTLATIHLTTSPYAWVDTTATNSMRRFYRAALVVE